jgi:hypothetical protein
MKLIASKLHDTRLRKAQVSKSVNPTSEFGVSWYTKYVKHLIDASFFRSVFCKVILIKGFYSRLLI